MLPSHSRLSPPEGQEQQQQTREQEERAPLVAFRENGLLKPVSGVEDLSAQQGAGQHSGSQVICHSGWSVKENLCSTAVVQGLS